MPSALDWLYSTQLFGIKLGLDGVHRLLTELRLPAAGQKIIHIAGTNGKGSTSAFIHSILKAAGHSAGLFTSPHLIHFRERIRDTQRCISDAEIESGLCRLRQHVQHWEPHPTFFELALALALDWFSQRENEWIVLETGLGGRLDATNAAAPIVSVLTPIGWDHMQFLGDTLEKIAAEKAGIIKPGIPVVTAPQSAEAMAVITRVAAQQGSQLIRVQQPCTHPLGLHGPHQQWNAALALAALQATGLTLSESAIADGLQHVDWPARFQTLRPGLILDGAHNPDSAQALAAAWRAAFGDQKAALVFGAVAGKDIQAVLHELAPICAEWHLTAFDSPRALSTAEVRQSLPTAETPIFEHPSPTHALRAIADKTPALICGSLYLAGEVLSLFQGQPESFQPSMQ
ncbi:MAG: bifunctional folylpolyglutamate synthase/dihydrofolate synthase [Verrucomicrobiaceae bacterium]|nr:bifunctional folylpolyglutamate synthase/dihydrofolate synthase [Verrucomicrobiaceae bacterium]